MAEPSEATLRIALGMRGGVSLAVWIGGGLAELDELRRSTHGTGDDPPPADDGAFYRALLPLGRYTDVEVDVMSGASAGGLNAVLGSACFVGGWAVREMRATWLAVGGLHQLLQPDLPPDVADDPERRRHRLRAERDRRSLLSGTYFEEQVLASVERFLREPPPEPRRGPPPAVDVFLSATILRGMPVDIRDDPFSPDEARRSDALFHFRHQGPAPQQSDFVGREAAGRLARAARTTASYPAAFEPVALGPGQLAGVLQLPGPTEHVQHLLDGGVIDNIPVARALDGIASRPAATPTDRWLMYLQPSPGQLDPTTRLASPTTPRIASVLLGLGNALRSETILDDIDVVRRHNVDAVDSWRAWSAAVGRLPATVGTVPPLDRTIDALRVHALLVDPAVELVWRPIGLDVPPSPLAALSGFERQQVRVELEEAVDRLDDELRPFAAHARTAAFLTRWARVVEPLAPEASKLKQCSYHLLHLAQLLTVQGEWRMLQQLRTNGGAGGAVELLRQHTARMRRSPAAGDLVRLVADGGELEVLPDAEARTLAALRGCGFEPVAGEPSTTTTDLVAQLWAHLGAIAHELGEHTAKLDLPRTASTATMVDLAVRTASGDQHAEGFLRLIDQRTATVHLGRATGQAAPVQYVRASGANVSPLALPQVDLPHSGPRFGSDALQLQPGQRGMASALKLAGSDLANFSAFAAQRWRANDWMWGRLDLAKSIVDVVTSPGRLPEGPAAARGAIEAALTAPMGAPVHEAWRQELDEASRELWAQFRPTIERELDEADGAPADARLLTTKRLLVLRRQWEVLGEELPGVLQTPLRPEPEDPPPVAPTLTQALEDYEAQPRSLSSVWGQGWLTALGVCAAYAVWTASRPQARGSRWLRAPLKPLPMALIGLVLARSRSLLALALALNLFVVPHLRSWVAWPALVAGDLLVLGLAFVFRPRRGPPAMPLEPHAWVLWSLAALTMPVGVAAVVARPGWWTHELTDWWWGSVHLSLTTDAIIVPLATGAAAFLLFHWARGRWRWVAGAATAGLFAWWSIWSTARSVDPEPAGWLEALFITRPMIWAVVLAVGLTTTIAHAGFRYRSRLRGSWQIPDYGKG